MIRQSLLSLLTIPALLLPVIATAQSTYPESLLNTKGIFSRDGAAAMGQPFLGVATSQGIIEGLFPMQDTGLSTASLAEAGAAFLASLDNIHLSRSHFPIDDPEWRNWSNVDVGIFARHGVSLEEMNDSQKAAAWNLLRVSLSAQGLKTTQDIMKTEQTLLELNEESIRYGEEKYYFTVMGIPSATEPWGWQLDGHHLVINYFIQGGQVVMTPTFLGGEPVVAQSGKYEGNTILQDEQDLGLSFMTSLDAEQQQRATVQTEKTGNATMAAANEDNMVLDYVGLPGSALNSAQKAKLLELVAQYVGNMRDDQAAVRMDQVALHLDDTYFSWVGAVDSDAVFYYRVHSPVVLIEFDHQNPVGTTMINPAGTPTRDHIHTVIRTPNGNDYGKDLLRQHLETHPH
ncbi:MAG: DUF3500 domain-containing protein [Gammaproteobacteria bacterium]